MVLQGRRGKVVSQDSEEDLGFKRVLMMVLFLVALFFAVLAVAMDEPAGLIPTFAFCAMGVMVATVPHPIVQVREGGIVVRGSILGERFYPWELFYYYYIQGSRSEDHPNSYVLVLSNVNRIYIEHPMTNLEAAHALIERNVKWRPRSSLG